MQVGRAKDQSMYNKPSAAVNPGALHAGTLLQYNTIPTDIRKFNLRVYIYIYSKGTMFCEMDLRR